MGTSQNNLILKAKGTNSFKLGAIIPFGWQRQILGVDRVPRLATAPNPRRSGLLCRAVSHADLAQDKLG
jgi:hypothetical protein